jgi:hypothetical protein
MKQCRSKLFFFALLSALSFTGLLPPQLAVSQEEAQSEFWPELDVYYRLDSQWRLFGLASVTRAREVEYTDVQLGTAIDYSAYPIAPLVSVVATDYERYRVFQFRLGYTYSRAIGENSGDYLEHRCAVDASIRIPVTERLLLSVRNRGDFRDINGTSSFRYRNRIRVERQTETALVTLNPYLSAEIYYDSRYEMWNRQSYAAGIEWTLSAEFVLETYYQRQNDSRSSPSAVNAFGLVLSFYH